MFLLVDRLTGRRLGKRCNLCRRHNFVRLADYSVFGAVRAASGESIVCGFVGMLGVERDPTGLLFMRNRYYSPTLGRFLMRDPIGIAGGDVNWYCYCGNDSVNFVDDDGLMSWSEWCKVFLEGLKGFGGAWADGSVEKGLAAAFDGMIPWWDPFNGYYGGADYSLSHVCGNVSQLAFLGTFGMPSINLTGSTQVITRWSVAGTMNSGDWVMLGGNTLVNRLKTTAPWLWKQGVKSVTVEVPKTQLVFPSEEGVIGGLLRFVQGTFFGQRILK